MKFLKWLLIVLAGLFGLFVVVSFFLPKEYHVERSILIVSPPELVYSQIVDLEAWQEWDPWGDMDPDMEVVFGDKTVGLGASYRWTSEMSGDGEMTIVETEPSKMVKYKLVFAGYEDNPSYSVITLEAPDVMGPTNVNWTFEGSVGDKLFARWMVLLMDKFVGVNYEKGLKSLEKRCQDMFLSPIDPEPAG
jgi:hypothetical protein